MSKTVLDYVEEANVAHRERILAMTKEQIMLEAFRITVWDEVVDYFQDYYYDEEDEDVLAVFATCNVVEAMWERLMRNYEIPDTGIIHDVYTEIIDAHKARLQGLGM